MNDEHSLLLGEIKGKLDLVIANQDAQGEQIRSMDGRLRGVETRAARNGVITGALAAVGIELAKAKIGLSGIGGA